MKLMWSNTFVRRLYYCLDIFIFSGLVLERARLAMLTLKPIGNLDYSRNMMIFQKFQIVTPVVLKVNMNSKT